MTNGSSGTGVPDGGGGASLYDRLGGRQAINGCVTEFYTRVLADPELAPFFEGVDVEALTHMQQEFFAAALGGPPTQSGSTLADTHAGRGIQPRHVASFTGHFIDTMLTRGLPPDAVAEVADRITLLAQDVVGPSVESG